MKTLCSISSGNVYDKDGRTRLPVNSATFWKGYTDNLFQKHSFCTVDTMGKFIFHTPGFKSDISAWHHSGKMLKKLDGEIAWPVS